MASSCYDLHAEKRCACPQHPAVVVPSVNYCREEVILAEYESQPCIWTAVLPTPIEGKARLLEAAQVGAVLIHTGTTPL